MKILMIEDHSVYGDGIRQLLLQMDTGVKLLVAGTCEEALTLVSKHPDLDLVLLDISMPDVDGFDAMEHFREIQSLLPIIMLSASDDIEAMTEAFDRGAMGYIPKCTSSAVMLRAIQLVLSGGVYIPAEMLQNQVLRRKNSADDPTLTRRQREVLDLMFLGHSNKEIGNALGVSIPTVKAHVSAIFKTFNVRNRTQVVIAARQLYAASS